MLQKSNLNFVTSVTSKIQVTTLTQIGSLVVPEVSLCTKFQPDSSYSYEVMVPNVIFDIFALSDPNIQDVCPHMNRH